jgi:hypothetical protein
VGKQFNRQRCPIDFHVFDGLGQAFRDNPERFVNKAPMPPDKPTQVWINPPTVRPQERV